MCECMMNMRLRVCVLLTMLLLNMIVLWQCTVGNWTFFPSLAFLGSLIELLGEWGILSMCVCASFMCFVETAGGVAFVVNSRHLLAFVNVLVSENGGQLRNQCWTNCIFRN